MLVLESTSCRVSPTPVPGLPTGSTQGLVTRAGACEGLGVIDRRVQALKLRSTSSKANAANNP